MIIIKAVKACCLTLLASLFYLTSFAQPTANFSAAPTSGCAPLVVNFIDQSTGSPTHWRWDLGNGTFSNLQNPSVTYFTPGQYNIKLVVQNASGRDSMVRNQYITIYAQPTVFFTASTTTGCFPLTVSFTDQSTPGSGTIQTWQWDFGDGTLSNLPNPTHTYTSAGLFNVSLRITNSNGCTKTLTRPQYINIIGKPRTQFTAPVTTACHAPLTVSFQNQTTGGGTISYQWNFGDGGSSTQTNPMYTYSANGTYTVTLIATNQNGCRDTLVRTNAVVIGNMQTRFNAPDSACVNSDVTFTNTSTPAPASVMWYFGDGTTSVANNPIKSYSTAGIYMVKLVAQYGTCTDSTTKPITILDRPTVDFSGNPLTACMAPLTVNFSNNSSGAVSYSWDFGNGITSTQPNPSYTYNNMGNYTVTLTATAANGCTSSSVRNNYVQIQPPSVTINIQPQRGCAPLDVNFTATVNSSDPVASYAWDFGDGNTSSQANPSHIFGPGIYDIQLIVTTASGCRDTAFVGQGVRAGIRPHAAFDATPRNTCAYIPVVFSDSSTGNVTDWYWDFGDGGTSIQQNPEHPYTDTGYFAVTLIASNLGCPDTLIIPDFIHISPPIASFAASYNCGSPLIRTFTDHSIGADTWNWDFGDGQTSTQQSPTHTFAGPGTYTISLTVFNNLTGCSHMKDQTITIYDEPIDFTGIPTIICKKDTVQFAAIGMNPANIISFAWTFGNGQTGTGQNPRAVYNNPGTYNVSLIMTDLAGCKDTLVRNQYIRVNGPTANFASTVSGTCLNNLVPFTDNSTTDGTNAIVRWIWNWGDGRIDTLTSGPFTHFYTTPGVYTVRLSVTDASGCSDSRTRSQYITVSRPVAAFTSLDTSTCPNRVVRFQSQSTGPNLTYLWDFGDGQTATVQNPTHNYLANGTYSIKLVVTDQFGCSDSLTRSNYVAVRSPLAGFTVSDSVSTCPPLIVDFTINSQNYTSFEWDFGDGATSLSPNPSHFYAIPGTYLATLTVTGPGGCTDVKTIPIVVRGPYGTFTYSPLNGCSPVQVNFVATTQNNTSFIWDFNDGNTITTTDSVLSHTYVNMGTFLPRMILRDNGGCVVPIFGTDSIHVLGVNANIDFSSPTLCDAGTVQFNSNSVSNDPITTYQWTFGDGGTSAQQNPAHNYTQTGLYYPTLVTTTQHGCTDSVRSTNPVKIVASPQALINQTANGCVPVTVNFSGGLSLVDSSALSWHWDFGNGTTGTGQNPAPVIYPRDGDYPIQLIVTNSSGCTDTVNSSVSAYPIPVVDAGIDTLICKGTGITLHATGADTYQWSPPNGLACTNCANPIANPDSLTQYVVVGTTIHGCSNRDSIKVAVKYPFDINFGGGDTLCFGEATRLRASGAHHFQWTPATGLDNATSPNPLAAPAGTTNYMVVGFDDRGCFTDTGYVRVIVYPIPTVDAGPDRTLNVGQTLDLVPVISPDVTEALWSPTGGIFRTDFPGITIKPRETTTYKVVVSNPGKCTASDEVTINVICNGSNVFIPNTFSPNDDGSNDVFYPRGTGLFTIKKMRIFNRWGEMIYDRSNFNANDANAGWDGSFRGQKLNPDVYVYVIEISCDNATTLNYKGNITLIR